jgi:hypothetical protein
LAFVDAACVVYHVHVQPQLMAGVVAVGTGVVDIDRILLEVHLAPGWTPRAFAVFAVDTQEVSLALHLKSGWAARASVPAVVVVEMRSTIHLALW